MPTRKTYGRRRPGYGRKVKSSTSRGYRYAAGSRGRTRARTSTGVSRTNGTPFGTSFSTKLTYTQRQNFAPAAAFGTQTFRTNSLFDPDLTGAGKQPLGFDELAALYDSYRVTGAKVTFEYINSAAVATYIGLTGHSLAAAVNYSTVDELMANPGTATKLAMSSTVAVRPTRISRYVSTAKLFGVDGRMVKFDDLFRALVTDNPTREAKCSFNAISADQTTAVTGVLTTKIVYNATFIDRKQIALS